MPSLIQARVVRAKIPDPQGRNIKNRRCIVVSSNDIIHANDRVEIVAVTTSISDAHPDEYVELQYGPTCFSGFHERCAAHCIWVVDIPIEHLEVQKGFIRPEYLTKILERIEALGPRVVRQRLVDRLEEG